MLGVTADAAAKGHELTADVEGGGLVLELLAQAV